MRPASVCGLGQVEHGARRKGGTTPTLLVWTTGAPARAWYAGYSSVYCKQGVQRQTETHPTTPLQPARDCHATAQAMRWQAAGGGGQPVCGLCVRQLRQVRHRPSAPVNPLKELPPAALGAQLVCRLLQRTGAPGSRGLSFGSFQSCTLQAAACPRRVRPPTSPGHVHGQKAGQGQADCGLLLQTGEGLGRFCPHGPAQHSWVMMAVFQLAQA